MCAYQVWITPFKLEYFYELECKEAKVVKYNHQAIAVYKMEGVVHAVNPACTHLKCLLARNNVKKSWDCPCHGSRFSFDGEVLTAPGTIALEKVQFTNNERIKHYR